MRLPQVIYDEMLQEGREIQANLEKSKVIAVICTLIGKCQVQVIAFLRLDPKDQRQRTIEVLDDGVEVAGHQLTDNEQLTISREITGVMAGKHWLISKGYYYRDQIGLVYYIKPDWPFWYSKEKDGTHQGTTQRSQTR